MVECKRNLSENKKVVIFDVDGVMTTGQFLYSSNGKEYKIFGPHDNDGIKMIRGIVEILFVTADKRGYPITERRIVDDMGQKLCLVSEDERYDFIEARYGMSNVVYMGDGYYDAKILKSCFFGIVPNNARVEAKESADYITPSNSGEGAVLDACLKIRELLCI
ncbi:hypothetical protein T235_11365 [Tannerella sp. oral taxon BU063 isolate Cell 8/11]|jgi:low specificity phosphatase (HAD superfamily)-like|uniref:Phosphatase n=1 Tax=Tannerella sp. oral taxon BU063 isolate Cell 8/11 TaxID=1411915 RepID=W2CYP5_9BACT|nr:hypothetical protein T235_11365 [Tannerella sp. oral taxon BU063 isolate Cell 8/11]